MGQLHIGILLVSEGVELLDCAPIGLFDELSKDYMKNLPDAFVPLSFKNNAADIQFHYIAEGGSKTVAPTTAGAAFRVTDDLQSCPQLDILLVPGPDPFTYRVNEATTNFLVKQLDGGLYALMTICSGILPVVQSGLLDGKKATAPKMLIPHVAPHFPTVSFSVRRWESDVTGPNAAHAGLKKSDDSVWLSKFDREKNGTELWSSGQVLNGMDMVAHFIKEKFPPEYAQWVMEGSDCAQRGAEYPA